jgi:hypothetical protein
MPDPPAPARTRTITWQDPTSALARLASLRSSRSRTTARTAIGRSSPASGSGSKPPAGVRTSGSDFDAALERTLGINRRLAAVVFALVCAFAVGMIAYTGRGTFFVADDWDMMLARRGLSPDTLLVPHVNHLVATQVFFYEAIRGVAGWHYGAYRVARVLLDVAIAVAVFAFARPRVGGWLAAALVVPMLFIPGEGRAVYTVGNVIALLTGIAALLVLDRMAAVLRRDVVVCVLLLLSVASFSFGLAFVGVAAIWLVTTPGQRRSLWVPAIPAASYALWLLTYHPPSSLSLQNLADTPEFVANSAAAALGGLTGLGLGWGRLLALLAALAIGYELFTRPVRRSPTTYALLALPLLLWALVGLGRAAAPPLTVYPGPDVLLQRFARLDATVGAGQSRYVFPGVIVLTLLAAQLLRGRRLGPPLAVALVLALLGVMTNLVLWRDDGATLRATADEVRGKIAAVEIAQPPEFELANFPGRAAKNLGHVANFRESSFRWAVGSVGAEPVPLSALSRIGPAGRSDLDAVLVAALPVTLSTSARAAHAGPCTTVAPGSPPRSVVVPGIRTTIRTSTEPATVSLRRFANPGTAVRIGDVPPASAAVLMIPRDRVSRKWLAEVVSPSTTRVCAVPPVGHP